MKINKLIKAMTFKEMEKILNIEVIEPEIVEPNVNRFYEWLLKTGNVYLNNHEQVVNAFNKIN